MKGVLNESTNTIHKYEMGASEPETACGLTRNVASDQLRITPVEKATNGIDASRCGRCFEDAGGY